MIEVGDTRMLPGECVVLDESGRGGLIRIETRDPRGERRRSTVRVPRSQVTILELHRDGAIEVVERHACDRTPFHLE